MHIYRSKLEPQRVNPTWEQRWEQADKGLVTCWERGREIADQDPPLAARARAGELVMLSWKGGVDKPVMRNQKYGSLFYLAMWQGLRGEDLNIHTDQEFQLTCAKHKTLVIFTSDRTLLSSA